MKERIFRPRVPVPSPAPAQKRAWGTSGTWGNQTPALDIDKLRSAYGPLRWLHTEQNFADVVVVESRIGYAATRHLLWTAQAAHAATRDDEVAALWGRAPLPYLFTNMGPEARDAIVRLIGQRAVAAWLGRPGSRTVAALADDAPVPSTSIGRPSPRAPWNAPGSSVAARASAETPGPREAPGQRDADAVADKVVRVDSAEPLLDQHAVASSSRSAPTPVQSEAPELSAEQHAHTAGATKLTPDELAELIDDHPFLREDVLAWAERIGGAAYVEKVLAAVEKRATSAVPPTVTSGSSADDAALARHETSAPQVSDPKATETAVTGHGASPGTRTDTTITHATRVESAEILHAEEIFADVPKNTDSKKHAFNRLNRAVSAEKRAEAVVAIAKTPKAVAKAQAMLTASQAEVAEATEAIKKFIANSLFVTDKRLKRLRTKLAEATKEKDTAAVLELRQTIVTRQDEIRTQVADMKHTDVGHTEDSVFAPVATDVTHHDFAFTDDEHVRVRDHVVAYATTASFGVDSEGPIDHARVRSVMATAGLSESRRKILQAISGLEGGFDTVNTYDRAKVTWGYVQWTGGSDSDLTQALTIIKQQHPDTFATAFQAYGIDVVKNEIVITPPDGSPTIRGEQAADAIMRNPRLAAVLAHAGRNEEIQKGEVQAAVQLEIGNALARKVEFGHGKDTITTTAGALITSEYGVGLLANTFVHSGSGAAQKAVHASIVGYVAKHPYIAGDEKWRAGAEKAILDALAAMDSDRASVLRDLLSTDPGSFK